MPPKSKITKEMIVDAAFEIARTHGAGSINARTVAQKLGCSTQPVMYHFSKIKALKKEVYAKADLYHTAYITNIPQNANGLEIALLYIRFAATEKKLFCFLFQSDEFSGKNLDALIGAEELNPILSMIQKAAAADAAQAREIFRWVFLFIHGYASMLANNTMPYDEREIAAQLEQAYIGAVYAAKGGQL